MSVAFTKDAVLARRKTVTRRAGWTYLTPGEVVTLCEKVMGRRHGEPLVRVCDVEVVSVRRERLDAITDEDVYLEGFTDEDFRTDPHDGTPLFDGEAIRPSDWFVLFYCSHMRRVHASDEVTRIHWRYLDE
jgi:uncharacterized protein YqfB (UPF0267 family)